MPDVRPIPDPEQGISPIDNLRFFRSIPRFLNRSCRFELGFKSFKKRVLTVAVEKRQVMREKHLESLPAVEIEAMLFFGKDPIPCYIVSITEEGFCVAVPDVKHYEGNPYLSLATKEATYPVKLIRQNAHEGGYSYVLKKTNGDFDVESESALPESANAGSKSPTSTFGIAATFVAMVAGTVFGALIGTQIPCFNLKQVGEGLANTGSRLNSVNSQTQQTLLSEPAKQSEVPVFEEDRKL